MSKEKLKDPFYITWHDIVQLINRNKKKVILVTLAFSLLGLWYSLTKPVRYEAEATFRERNKSQAALSNSMATLLMLSGTSMTESEAQSMMESRLLFEPLIKKMGLQAIVGQAQPWSWGNLGRIRDNLKITYAYAMHRNTPIFPDPRQDIVITNVEYSEEIPSGYKLKFTSDTAFDVWKGKEIVGEGRIGVPFSHHQNQFTVNPKDKIHLQKNEYSVLFLPMAKAFEKFSKGLNVKVDNQDSRLLNLSYVYSDRHVAANIVNSVMDQYILYLNDVHHKQAEDQLSYLDKRQKESSVQLLNVMEKHASSLATDLSNNGFPDSTREMEFLASRLEKYKGQLLANELEAKRLSNICATDCVHYDQYTGTGDSIIINQILGEIRTLKHQCDALELALHRGNKDLSNNSEDKIDHQDTKLEFQGISLATAQELFMGYCRKLNENESIQRQHEHLVERIGEADFEVSSLSSILTDPVSHEMVKKAAELDFALKDEGNRTVREQERIRQELNVQRRFITSHLQQTNQLLKLNENLIKEKITSLREVMLDLSHQQISLLEKSLKDYVTTRLDNLVHERTLVQDYVDEVHQQMAVLPKKWVNEQLIKQEMDTNRQVAEELTKMVESKNITRHLELIQSTPIDLALAPILPKSPRLLLHMFLGALFGAFASLSFLTLRSMATGVSASTVNLNLIGQPVAGTLLKDSKTLENIPTTDKNLETLRRLSAQITKNQLLKTSILLIEGKGIDYAHDFGNLMAKRGGSVLLISLSFDKSCNIDQQPGLLQYLQGNVESPNITKVGGYDFIAGGGINRYGNEMLGSKTFKDLIDNLKSKYDWVIGYTHAEPLSSESEGLVGLFSQVVVSVTSETLDDLKPYMDLNDSANQKASFIFT